MTAIAGEATNSPVKINAINASLIFILSFLLLGVKTR